ncbi:Long-chain base-1-phosphate phosphatase [Oleoguttula sp. CCFEE 5521]
MATQDHLHRAPEESDKPMADNVPDRAWSRTPSPFKDPDAGLKGIDHYQNRLPRWRYRLRQQLIPIVRLETPYLARFQETCRSPVLDSYFAMTANLGTHTFFMAGLPVCFWCGYRESGIAMVHMLAAGVYLSGYVKDMLCLPRPLSPPLQRITMSGSAALEYGFPSTHTTNAVSVAVYLLFKLHTASLDMSPAIYYALAGGLYCYAISISIGRMYCGMHGFFDVIFGSLLGGFIAWVRIAFGPAFDTWIVTGGWLNLGIAMLILGLAVRFHPEPADNCPCFDDSVAFTGVVMGGSIAWWDFPTRSMMAEEGVTSLKSPEDYLKMLARIIIGIVIVFLWRAIAKPTLLRCLPPIFRFVDHWGFRLPRRYFLQARYYQSVPALRKDDNVIPPASEIPSMLSKTRKRTISIGPQSEADVREFIANRAQQRRNSRSGEDVTRRRTRSKPSVRPQQSTIDDVLASPSSDEAIDYLDAIRPPRTQRSLHVKPADINLLTPPLSDAGASSDSGKEDEQEDRNMFSALDKPRIRYDVEVITKLVVYAGIAWLAIEGNPLLFEAVGLF